MKKKVFSLMMTLFLAFMGVAKAEVVTIGEGTTTTYVTPFNSLWGYSFVEQVYTADEIGTAGTINSISFYLSSGSQTNSVDVFMKNVSRSTFSSVEDYEPVSASDMVFSGTVSFNAGWTTITLNTPFEYDGSSNLLIGMHEYTSGYSTLYFNYTSASNTVVTFHSDGADPNPYNLTGYTGNKYTSANRANIQIDITPGGGGGGMTDRLHVKYMDGENEIIDSLNLGVRPVNAWMEPFEFTMYSDGPAYTVTVLDFTPSDGLFSVEGEEVPFQVTRTDDVDLVMATNATQAGVIERQFVAITNGDRAAHIWPIVVEMYDPAVPDVWEKACTQANHFPFVEVPATAHNTTLHNDYTLPFPEIPEGLDAVYKLVFTQDQMVNAEVTYGDNGKVALYREGFEGEGGPMATNNYTGLNLAGGGAAAAPFEVQIGEGTSTNSYLPFYCFYNYSISQQLFLAAELEEAGVTSANMTSLSWYCTGTNNNLQSNITIWMANVDETAIPGNSIMTAGMSKVYTGNMTPVANQWNEFVFNEGTFSWDGHSNILISVQRNNGAWASGVNWQAGTQNFTAGGYSYNDSGYGAYNMETTSYVFGSASSSYGSTTTSRANIIMKADGSRDRNRDVILTEGFENGLNGWTMNNCNSSTGVNNGYTAHSGDYLFRFYYTTNYPQYLISPELTGTENGVDVSFYYAGYSTYYAETFHVGYSTTTNDVNAFTFGPEISVNDSQVWYEYTNSFPAGTKYVAVKHTSDDQFYLFVDDFTFSAESSTPTPGPDPTPSEEWNVLAGPVIENLGVTPGTYYLVASSTDPDFEVTINAEAMPCPMIEAEDFAFNPQPADNEDEIEPNSVTLRWQIPQYATGWRLIFGSTYHPEANHPQTIMYPEDGSFTTEMANSYTVRNLWNNTNYFWRVEFNNDGCPDGVSSPVFGFTTHLNVPQNLTAVDETIFNDEQVVLNWNAVVDRTYRYYNVYRDGELIDHTTVNNIGNTTYTDGPLAYNMNGYVYYVTAVYDEGESAPSNTVTVKVSGYGDVNGHVYEQDGTTGIAGATVTMVGHDEFNVAHTYNLTTNNQGYYTGHIYAGSYNGQAAKDGYQTIYEPVQGNPIAIYYNGTTSPIDYMLDENFDPVCTVIAEYYPDSLDPESPYVKVYWGCGLPGEEIIEPFETGDFSLFDWQVDPTYPWSITTNNPYEGTYCMKSGGAGVANVVSNMTVTVDIPADGLMSFYGKISSENNWDYGYFYIDGVQKGQYTGAGSWGEKKFDITQGTHTFQWRYTKDGSVNSNDDCFYVDYITFYKRPEPAQPGWHTYCESEFNNALGSTLTTTPSWAYEYPASFLHANYAGWQITKVSLFSDNLYSAVGGNYTCRIYVGGTQPAAGTMVSTITVDVPSNQNAWVDYDLTDAVNVTGNDPIWVVWTANTATSSWPAGLCGDANECGDWWDGGNGWDHQTYGVWTMRQWFTNRAGRSVAVGTADNVYNAVADVNPLSSQLRTPVKGEEANEIVCANPNAVKGAAVATDGTRSLHSYRIYRTNCYNDGPYTEENTVLLATNWPMDTIYIDVEWADLEPGVYKWGVGCVYAGNRGEMTESPINWAAPVAITRDATAENDPNPVMGEEGVRAPWDLMMTFTAAEGGHYGVAYDGNNFYTSNWGYTGCTNNFYKYDLSGNMIEGFNISGCGTLRGITYDGTYFYGVANSATVYCVDLANHSVVSTFTSAYGAQRGITYDPQRDGFWVIGNWSGNLTLIDRTGAIQFTGPAPTSASDLAYYKDENDVEHIYCFNNGDGGVYDYNITTNTMGGSVFNFGSTPGATSTSSGGCTVGVINGKEAFIGDLQQSPNLIGIYELRDASVGPTPGPGGSNLNQLALPRESETIWSNCLDKDMYLDANDVTVNVLLNSADSPEGVQVTFTNYNEAEQEMYPIDPIIMDETGYYAFESFRRGNYNIKVEFDGYEPIEDSVSIWEPTDLRYVMIEIIYGVSDLYVSSTGWAMWGAEGIPSGGGQGGGTGDSFSVDFEGGLPAGWTAVDGNNDGWTWCATSAIPTTWTYYSSLSLDWYHSGSDAMCSGSYINGVGALNPDEYLVSPRVNLGNGSTFSFWAAATDANYPAEHFGVFVSDDMSNWTSVNEWTLTAKSASKAGDVRASRDGNGNRLGNWYQYSVDLSAYAGQKYIAIRHFNCYDQYIICVDDVELTNGAKNEGDRHLEAFKVMCTSIDGEPIYNNNVPADQPFCQLATEDLEAGEHYICKVAAIYSTGMSSWTECEWQYIPCTEYAGTVNGLTIEGTTVSWDYPGGGPVPPQPGQGDTFTVNFDDSQMPAGWTVIDGGSPAGYGWQIGSTKLGGTGNGHNGSADLILSQSYDNNYGVVYPDNWFISPAVTLANGSTFSFWACGQDAGYAAEHCGVFVSTTGTNPSDFTMVQDWTLSAKSSGEKAAVRGTRDQGTWRQYTVNLSDYAGEGRYIAIRHFNCSDMFYLDVDDVELTNGAKDARAPWDLMYTWTAAEAAQYGVVTDGNNFYTSNWGYSSATHNFYKYDMQGNMIEGFEVAGCGTLRGMTYDGTYFYGVANSSTVYCVDLANHNLVSTFTSAYGAMRGITYDPVRDGFWVIGNWSGNLTLIDRTGAIVQVGPEPTSASDLAYYKDENDVEHVFCFNNGDNGVYDYNITTNTLGGSVYNFNSLSGVTGSAGGCHVASINGKIAFIGDIQQDPNLIGVYELRDDNTPTPGPTPTGDVLGAMIFVDGEWEAFVEYPTNNYEYEGEGSEVCVRMVYNGTNNLPEGNIYYSMSCPECEEFDPTPQPGTCEPGAPIHAEQVTGAQIKVWWGEQPAEPIEEWLYYFDVNATQISPIGTGSATDVYWGIMIPADMLAPYVGTSLTKMSMYQIADYNSNAVTVNIFLGGSNAPQTLVSTMTYTPSVFDDFEEVTLTTAVPVDGTQNLWITVKQNGTYPALGVATTGNANARWISLDGTSWEDVATYNLNYDWLMMGYVTNQAKGGEVTPIEFTPGTASANMTLSQAEMVSQTVDMSFMNRASIVKYNVYRSTEAAGDYTLIGEVAETGATYYEYIDEPETAGTYYYQVRAYYDDDCESEPAQAADDPTHNYVTGTSDGIGENSDNVALYPNPTNGNVTIEANGMSRITVVSVLGQVVYDTELSADTYTLNMGQFNAGLYMVRVYTENGVTVKRVTVMQ